MRFYLCVVCILLSWSVLATGNNVVLESSSPAAIKNIRDYALSADNSYLYVTTNQSFDVRGHAERDPSIFRFSKDPNGNFTLDQHLAFDSSSIPYNSANFQVIPLPNDLLAVLTTSKVFVFTDTQEKLEITNEYDFSSPLWSGVKQGLYYAEYSQYHNKIIALADVNPADLSDDIELVTKLVSIGVNSTGELTLDGIYSDVSYSEAYKPQTLSVSDSGRIFVGHQPDKLTGIELNFVYQPPLGYLGEDTGNAALAEFSLVDDQFSLIKSYFDGAQYQADN